jgi:hypothetical protein
MGADHHVAAVLDNLEEGKKFFLGKSGGEHGGKLERRNEKGEMPCGTYIVYLANNLVYLSTCLLVN